MSNFDDFTKKMLAKIAAGAGVSYEDLTKDLDQAEASADAARVAEAAERWKKILAKRHPGEPDFIDPVKE